MGGVSIAQSCKQVDSVGWVVVNYMFTAFQEILLEISRCVDALIYQRYCNLFRAPSLMFFRVVR